MPTAQHLPARLDVATFAGDDWSLNVSFTDSSDDSAYPVTAGEFTASVGRAGGDVTLTVAQVDANTLRLSATEDVLGTATRVDQWTFHHTPSDRTWLAGRFLVTTTGTRSGASTSTVQVAAAGDAVTAALTVGSFTAADRSKLDGIEADADVTDADSVNAAGAVMASDTDTYATVEAAAPSWLPAQRQIDTMVTTFAPGHGFSLASAAGTQTDDTSDFALGSQSLKLVSDGDDATVFSRNTALPTFDATGKQVVVWVKVDSTSNINEMTLYLSSGGSLSSFYRWHIDKGWPVAEFMNDSEWTAITLNFGDATVFGTPDRALLDTAQVRVSDDGTAAATMWVGGIALESEPASGVVSFTFDDGWDSQYDEARRKMDEYGFAGTAFIIRDGDPTKMDVAQLSALQNLNGWEIACHGKDVYPSFTEAELDVEFRTTKDWLTQRGLTGKVGVAYVGGQFDATVLKVARRHFQYARTTHGENMETWPPADPHRLRVFPVLNTTSAAAVAAAVTQAIDNNQWLILMFHKLVASSAVSTEVDIADFETMVDDVASQGAAVRTVGDVIRRGI